MANARLTDKDLLAISTYASKQAMKFKDESGNDLRSVCDRGHDAAVDEILKIRGKVEDYKISHKVSYDDQYGETNVEILVTRDYTSPEVVARLLNPPQSYGNGYECCKQQIALAQELKATRRKLGEAEYRGNLLAERQAEFHEAIRVLLRDAGYPDIPTWLRAHQATQAEVKRLKGLLEGKTPPKST